ncbi:MULTISPECIES: PIN domain nuclease [unclassified Frankia]|uniref:type II toxin-antitoxin system VapC family toxin n=1 Tax=unclassified Frankia TaxID=2632575 RepID=UPI002AD29916|nr:MULTISPECIES: PIN domain nuclease [unclassified Frankia]
MILVDTSAWVEFFRKTESPVHRRLHHLIDEDAYLVTTEIVRFELLAGARSDTHHLELLELLAPLPVLPLRDSGDYEDAAGLYRSARRGGVTVRVLTDCLIAQAAVKADASLLHADRDFDHLARVTDLRIEPVA